jgi:hypothetical protein
VRLNRDRLKGAEGEGQEADIEAETGLQVLYDVLLNVSMIFSQSQTEHSWFPVSLR